MVGDSGRGTRSPGVRTRRVAPRGRAEPGESTRIALPLSTDALAAGPCHACAMTVLVAYASKHGATREIAEALGRDLRSRGIDTDVIRADEVGGVEEYDAVVL